MRIKCALHQVKYYAYLYNYILDDQGYFIFTTIVITFLTVFIQTHSRQLSLWEDTGAPAFGRALIESFQMSGQRSQRRLL